jgi:hypothetical protein
MTEDINPETGRYYEIKIEGHLDEARLAGWGEMRVSLSSEGQTLISGRIADQAALFGILIRIRDMGVSLISVTCSREVKS